MVRFLAVSTSIVQQEAACVVYSASVRSLILLAAALVPAAVFGQSAGLDARVQSIVDGVSEARVSAIMQKLESFGTRGTLSPAADPEHGIGAARRWIYEQFRGYSPRLQVRYDTWHVKKDGKRIVRDVDLVNVVAVLPGALHPDREILVSGHYDSLALVRDAGAENKIDWEKTADAPIAPGVSDDGSGVAAVMELARVMSQNEFPNTVVFIAFAGEEQGLIGSTLYAQKAREDGAKIEGVLNNDIIGTDVGGDGRRNNREVNVYSGDPADSPSRTLARYIRSAGNRYFPEMRVNLVFRDDRFGRGGDHTPFDHAGYAAVRFTTTTEDYSHQHNPTDTFANASPAYTALVTRVNGAALASLALAPIAPHVERISRGTSGYDAVLSWSQPAPEPELAGYVVVMRATTAPYWEHAVAVGNVHEYVLRDVPIDDVVFGVKAVDRHGNESLVSPWVITVRPDEKIEAQQGNPR